MDCDIKSLTGYTLSMFGDDTKRSGTVDALEGRDTVQIDFDRIGEQAYVNLMQFSKAKCKNLLLCQCDQQYQYSLEDGDLLSEKVKNSL